jgi:putative hemolysin
VQAYVFDIIVILILTLLNGVLAMTEIAIISSNRTKMEYLAKQSDGAKVVLEMMDDNGSFLSTIQIGITIIGLISGAFSGQRFAEPMGEWLNSVSYISGYGNIVSFCIILIGVTYISIVLGELVPKRIAISHPEKIAIILALPVRVLSKITSPFVSLLSISSKFILKMLMQEEIKEYSLTEEEIHSVMQQGFEKGAIDEFEHKVFRKVLQFGDREASIIMTPRIKVVFLDLKDTIDENMHKILKNPHRYYPVFEGGIDNFKGIIDTKDALAQVIKNKKIDLRTLVKEAPCVIEDNLGPDLISKFKKYKTHIALVVDEYGSMQGIITLVDLFETLVGNMPESQQDKHYEITQRKDGSWLCDGLTPIDDIEDFLKVDVFNALEEVDFNTLAGFLLTQFNRIPKAGDFIIWETFRFEIMDMDGTRIDKVLIQNERPKDKIL